MDSTIGMRIKQLREAKQMSVADFAKAAGVKPSAIYGLEGDANKPSIETVAMLRKSFPDLNTEWLQFGDGSMYKSAELTPAPASATPPQQQGEAESEPVAEVPSLNKIERTYHAPMAIAKDVEDMTPDEQIAYYKLAAELAEEELSALKAAQRHEKVVRLVKSAGGQSFTNASPEAADTHEPAQMSVSYVAPEWQRFVAPAPAAYERRPVGFGVNA